MKQLQLILRWLITRLAHPRAPWVIALLGLTLNATALGLGLTFDDHMHAVALRPDLLSPGMERAPWDLFAFAKDPATNSVLMEEGVFPWWTDPTLVISFMRPLASLSHWVDHALWPHSYVMMHAHSLLWFGLLLAALWRVYRSVLGAGSVDAAAFSVNAAMGNAPGTRDQHGLPVAALALLLYALDDARSYPVAWIANRNALMALSAGFLSIYAHHRFRSGDGWWWSVVAVLLLALGLSAGEPGLSVVGYLAAYALCMDRAPLMRRALSVLPYLLLVIAWRLLYNQLGYGALHSGMYLDPGREPITFSAALVVRLPILMLSQFALPIADLWDAYPLMASWVQPAVYVFALCVLGTLGWLFWPLLRRDPRARFFLVGALFAAVPACAVYVEDRVLTASSLGGAALVAMYLSSIARDELTRPRWLTTSAGFALVTIHLVIAPLILPPRILAIDSLEHLLESPSVPTGDAVRDKTVVLLNPPIDVFAVYLPPSWLTRGQGLPGGFRWFASGESALHLERIDVHTLKVTPENGFLETSSQRMFRRSERPMTLGQRVQLSDVSFEVSALTADGRPASALVRFNEPLDSPKFVWMLWDVKAYRQVALPAVGESMDIPAAELKALLLLE